MVKRLLPRIQRIKMIYSLSCRLLVRRLVGDGRVPAFDPARNRGRLPRGHRRPHGEWRTKKSGRGREPNLCPSQKCSWLPRPRYLRHPVSEEQNRRRRIDLQRGRFRPMQPSTLSGCLSHRNHFSRSFFTFFVISTFVVSTDRRKFSNKGANATICF